jgi:hypothetical protein
MQLKAFGVKNRFKIPKVQPKIVSRRTDQTRLRKYGTTRQTRNYITTIEDYLDDNP